MSDVHLQAVISDVANLVGSDAIIRNIAITLDLVTQATGTIDRAFRHQLVTRNVSVRVGGKGYSLRTKKVAFVFDASKSARRAYIAGNDTPAPQP